MTDPALFFSRNGPLARVLPDYEERPAQRKLAQAVAEVLDAGGLLLAEAGTGTGKSVAYLLPAIAYAAKNNTRVVISTNTINLQDQLIIKDIPDVRTALGVDLRAVVLKGRANYLCPRRLEGLRKRQERGHWRARPFAVEHVVADDHRAAARLVPRAGRLQGLAGVMLVDRRVHPRRPAAGDRPAGDRRPALAAARLGPGAQA